MTARVLRDLLPGDALRVLDLGDRELPVSLGLIGKAFGGSRRKFLWSAATSRCSHLITDACNLGQLQLFPNLRRKPHLTFLHGIEIWETARPRWVKSARRATVKIVNSRYSLDRAERCHGPFPNSIVCPLATESDDPAPARIEHPGPSEVLIVGRLVGDRPKGHRELIEVWDRVSLAVPGAILRIVGRGPDETSLRELAAKSNAAAKIVFEGFVPDERLDELYARATAFAMPSRGEGFGLVYIEAMRYGLPVIASIHDAAPEIVADGRTGFLIDLDRPGQLAERVIELLRAPELARRMGDAGRAEWSAKYRFSAFRDRLKPVLIEFLRSNKN